jgi:hypothetical protein
MEMDRGSSDRYRQNYLLLTAWVFSLRNNSAGPLIILGAHLAGSILLVSITTLIIITALSIACLEKVSVCEKLGF